MIFLASENLMMFSTNKRFYLQYNSVKIAFYLYKSD